MNNTNSENPIHINIYVLFNYLLHIIINIYLKFKGENSEDMNDQNEETGLIKNLLFLKEKTRKDILKKLHEKNHVKGIKSNAEKASKDAMAKLIKSSAICIVFMIVELIGGLLSGSLAILSDAAHMLSDFSGFAVSMFSIIVSQKKANSNYSFGYHRAQIIGALTSVIIIWFLTIWLIVEAYDRVVTGNIEILGGMMFVVAVIGLICNLYMMQILHQVKFYNKHN